MRPTYSEHHLLSVFSILTYPGKQATTGENAQKLKKPDDALNHTNRKKYDENSDNEAHMMQVEPSGTPVMRLFGFPIYEEKKQYLNTHEHPTDNVNHRNKTTYTDEKQNEWQREDEYGRIRIWYTEVPSQ